MSVDPVATLGMGTQPPLSWGSLLGNWRLEPAWLVGCLLLAGGYAHLWLRSGTVASSSSTSPTWTRRRRSTVHPWRVASFMIGCSLLWSCVASGIGSYAMSLFWMHMVLHLLLIMVVPLLLVLGHPITVTIEALRAQR